jgi:hypothetical protein
MGQYNLIGSNFPFRVIFFAHKVPFAGFILQFAFHVDLHISSFSSGSCTLDSCTTKEKGNGRAIGKTFEKTTPEHLRDVSTRKSQWQNDSIRRFPRMHVLAVWGGIRRNQKHCS